MDKLEKYLNDEKDFILLEATSCEQCKGCKFRQPDTVVKGKTVQNYNSAICSMHKIKPFAIMMGTEDCEYKETGNADSADDDLISKADYNAMMKKMEALGGKLTDDEKKRRKVWMDAKYIPQRFFERHSSKEINDIVGFELINDNIRDTMIIYQRIEECVKALIARVSNK